MEKNNSKIGIADAMKIYNGCDPVIQTVSIWSIATLIFLLWYIILRFVLGSTIGEIDQGDGEVLNGVSRTTFTMFMSFICTIGTFIFQIQEFYKESAGGKYFRSVRGGFSTYGKMKTGQLLQCICGQALYSIIILLIAVAFHLVNGGLAVCATVFLVSLIGTASGKLICMIKNQAAKNLLFFPLMGFYMLVCTSVVGITDGHLATVHIIILIIAAILIPVSHFADLKNFRKYHWYE